VTSRIRNELIGEGKLQFRRFEIDVPIYRQANATKQIYKAWMAMKTAEFGQYRQKDKKRVALSVGFLRPFERLLSITQ
jgi:hypothetical protein